MMNAGVPYFSTIIAVYNRAALIRATLDSALAQAEGEAHLQEIIVVDDGSTDGTPAVLQAYQSRYPDRLRSVRQSNAGPGIARNRGIREARGRYICFLDSDDLWFPWTLRAYRTVIDKCHEPSFIIATAFPFSDASTLPTSIELDVPVFDEFADFYSSANSGLWHGCSVAVVRADALRAAGGFAERNINAEDTDLWMKLGVAPCFVHVRSPFTAGYREHAGSAVANMTKTLDGMLFMIEQERTGRYPGSTSRRSERITMLTRHLRAASMHCLAAGDHVDAWRLYRASFAWNLRLSRFKYLFGFPAAAAGVIQGDRNR